MSELVDIPVLSGTSKERNKQVSLAAEHPENPISRFEIHRWTSDIASLVERVRELYADTDTYVASLDDFFNNPMMYTPPGERPPQREWVRSDEKPTKPKPQEGKWSKLVKRITSRKHN
ncbi:hypothetical protein ACFL2V_21815 [Pseudomonadota bacterium]